jgi:hypothetical protein
MKRSFSCVRELRAQALVGLMACLALSPAWAQEALPILARVGPWPVASRLIGYQDRLWLANSVKGVNHNSADLYSYDPDGGALRYERHLFSQDAGRPVVADGLLYWPFEDARSSLSFGHFMVTDGRAWRLGTIPTAQIFHTHAMAAMDGGLIAATSAWRAGFQRSDDQGLTWRQTYDHPTPDRRVSRIVELVALDKLFGSLASRNDPGLVVQGGDRVEKVPDWPHGRPILGLAGFEDQVYGLVREPEGVSVWRTDGQSSERIYGPRADWPARDIAAGDQALWVVTAEETDGALWHSADGATWDQQYRLEGGRPFEVAVYRGAIYVGGAGDDGRGILWGQAATAETADAPGMLPVRPKTPERDWAAAGLALDQVLLDPATYTERTGRLRDMVFGLALAEPPEGLFADRLSAVLPSDELSLIGGNVTLEAAQYARWILLWGMTLSGKGQVPAALIAEPWTTPANRGEKYFQAPPGAMWAASIIGQRDPATIDALIERLSRDDEPPWLRGDAIGALSALTNQRLGYDVAAWQDWWRNSRLNWAE